MEVFYTAGTCSRQIVFKVDENDCLTDLRFIGGCAGNLQAISRLAVGLNIDTVISKLSGILCRANTSCPDQLAKALVKYKNKRDAVTEQPEPEKIKRK